MKNKIQILQVSFFFLWFVFEIISLYSSYKVFEEQKSVLKGYGIREWYYAIFNPIIAFFCLVVVCSIKSRIERNKVFFFIPIFWIYALILYILDNPIWQFVVIKVLAFIATLVYVFVWFKKRDKLVSSKE